MIVKRLEVSINARKAARKKQDPMSSDLLIVDRLGRQRMSTEYPGDDKRHDRSVSNLMAIPRRGERRDSGGKC